MSSEWVNNLTDRDLRDLAIEYELLPDPSTGYMPYLNTEGRLEQADREWIIRRVRAAVEDSPPASDIASQHGGEDYQYPDDAEVSVDTGKGTYAPRRGGSSPHTGQSPRRRRA